MGIGGTRAWRASQLLKRLASARAADLHVHTRISDGAISPRETVEQARRAGLRAIAIADHDSVSGIQHALWAGQRFGVEIVPSVEVSSGVEGKELHILGYFVDWQNRRFLSKLERLQEFRRQRAKQIVEKLRGLGVPLSYSLVVALNGGVVGRPHIAQALVDAGYVRSLEEAFDTYLGVGKPAYVKHPLAPEQAIELVLEVGGFPALAHPRFARADELLPSLVEAGLRGLEVYHSFHTPEHVRRYRGLARRLGLLATGGSDSHGQGGPAIGSVRVPYSVVERIKRELRKGER